MNLEIFNCVMIFIIGLIFGSFYNVVAYRLPNKMSIVFPSSHCTNCNHKLKFYELIPVLSYIISDIKYYIIPDEVLVVGIILIIIEFIINTFINNLTIYEGIMSHILNGLGSFAVLYLFKCLGDLLFKKESLGGGDIKLLFLIGLVLGFDMSIVTIFIASFIALPLSIISLIRSDNNVLAFGPYLSVAATLILLTHLNIDMILQFFIK